MNPLIVFLAARFFSRTFWLLVLSTFFGVLMIAMRNFYRNQIFQDAVRSTQPLRFNSYANRF